MTQIAPPPSTPPQPSSPPAPAAATAPDKPAARDIQRQSLEELVKLSIECTAQEQRIEQEHTDALAKEHADFKNKVRAAKERHQRKTSELAGSATQKQESIQGKYDTQRQEIEAAHQKTEFQLKRKKEETDSALKKEVEQGAWQAESVLVTLEMKVDADEQAFKKEMDASKAELGGLAALEEAVRQALAKYRVEPFAVETPMDEALKQRIAGEPKAVLAEQKQMAAAGLQELQLLTQSRAADDVVPFILMLALAGALGVTGWFVGGTESNGKMMFAGGGGALGLILGIMMWVVLRVRTRNRIRAKSRLVYAPFAQATAIARVAATLDPETAAAARQKRVNEARKKRDLEVQAAKDKGKARVVQAAEGYRAAVAEEAQNYKLQLQEIEEDKTRRQEELEQNRQRIGKQIEDDDAAARQEAQTLHTAATGAIESAYERECQALTTRWNDGLRAVTDLLAAGTGIDPQLIDWNSPAWESWKSPAEFSGLLRFGDMKVDLAQLTEQLPKRLKLPETFSVPAMLSMPTHASLLLETDHTGRNACNDVAQMVMARLLTQMPAGRAKFTIIDPVGLGQSFAGFMHLVDHDESLVGSRIWTEKEHIHQRLADLTEHMETVIQKYLRNEYATIDEYNAQAGELAEPFRFLVIADFPTGFEHEALRRLSSIALTGPRCGVYTIIIRDLRQAMPQGARMEDIVARSVRLQFKNNAFVWDDAVFRRFPLRLDPPPEEKRLTHLMDMVGKAAKEAKRVEVPFASIAPSDDQFWSMSSKSDLRVPIGKSGATRLQSLKLGVGVAQHALVAGKTGSGKSNLMHTIVTNMAMWYSPAEVEFFLIDFKKGVEFKAYATSQLPHARAIAVESDREFGLSVLQRVDAELTRRGTMFRDAGVQEISAFRDKTGQQLPRCVLLIDEFQEFFSEDDKLGQEAASLMDRLVRQGRAFGVHLVLGSQSIGGTSGLGRSTLGQVAVRVALQCTEADSQMILGDNNSAARLLTRPGEAVYNDAGGLVEANSPFQIAFLPDKQREDYLERVRKLAQSRMVQAPVPIVFEGNSAAAIRKNQRLMTLLADSAYPPASSSTPGYVGEPVAIKEPTAVRIRRQSGVNVLMVGQDEESAVAIFASIMASVAAQHKPEDAQFYIMDGSPNDSRYFGLLERVAASFPHKSRVVGWRDVPDAINELATALAQRQEGAGAAAGGEGQAGPTTLLLIFGVQRYRLLRKQEEDFSFRKSEEGAAPKTDKQFAELLAEGPALGIHNILWADTPISIERTLDRGTMRQFDYRILFQMSAADSSNLIDSPVANRLGGHRALVYSEEQGTIEKFRPYEVPDDAWLKFLADRLKNRPS